MDPGSIQARWQHVLIIFGIMFLLFGGIFLAVSVLPPPNDLPARRTGVWAPLLSGTAILIGIVFIRLGWRSLRRTGRKEDLARKARQGAVDFGAYSPRDDAVLISYELHRSLGLPEGSIRGTNLGELTASRWGEQVWLALQQGISTSPAQLDAAYAIAREYGQPAELAGLCASTPVDRVIPSEMRRTMWDDIDRRTKSTMPNLEITELMHWTLVGVGVGLTVAIILPLAALADAGHPVQNDPAPVRMVLRLIVRGGFFFLFVAISILLRYALRRKFTKVPEACVTVGQIASFLDGNERSTGTWTRDRIDVELRGIFAQVQRAATDRS